jgi:hypothetical protein
MQETPSVSSPELGTTQRAAHRTIRAAPVVLVGLPLMAAPAQLTTPLHVSSWEHPSHYLWPPAVTTSIAGRHRETFCDYQR